jgi:hypothetical protein
MAPVEIYDVDLAAERVLQVALERKVVARGEWADGNINVGSRVEVARALDGTENDRRIDAHRGCFKRLHQSRSGRRPELLALVSLPCDRAVQNAG